MAKRILIVDDDATRGVALARLAASVDAEAVTCGGAAPAIACLASGGIDLCLVDLDLPAAEGAAVVLKARACRPPVTVVALTARGDGAVEALCAGAAEIVAKPLCSVRLTALLRRLADDEAARRSAGGSAVVGDHPRVREALARVDHVAGSDAPVLLRGETGTGKETLARLIHGASARRAGPFVAVNLAGIGEALIEGELFGHPVEAEGGGDRARAGWITAAQGGTLFVEEIDQLPRHGQERLRRVLHEQAIAVAGGAATALDVRLVVATRGELRELVSAGLFDGELFTLLAGVAIALPPLRERREDIPALAEHFRRQVNAREGRRVPGFALDVMRRLSRHDWPGNVRELEHLCERLVVTAGTRMVVMKDLPAHLRIQVLDFDRWSTRDLPANGVDLRGLLTEVEERLIGEALARAGGDRARAADLLGLDRTALIEKLRRRYVA